MGTLAVLIFSVFFVYSPKITPETYEISENMQMTHKTLQPRLAAQAADVRVAGPPCTDVAVNS